MAVAIGSSIQIALLVLPFLVLLAWALGQPLSLNVDTLEVLLLFVTVIMVTQAIGDGRSNWVEGLCLIAVRTSYLDRSLTSAGLRVDRARCLVLRSPRHSPGRRERCDRRPGLGLICSRSSGLYIAYPVSDHTDER